MTLTKETVVDKIEVLESNAIQVRSAIRVLEDGEVLSSSYHRHVLQPGDDLSNEDPKVVAIANAAWAWLVPFTAMPDLSDDAWKTANKVFEEYAGEGPHGFEMNRNEFLDAVEELLRRLSLWA